MSTPQAKQATIDGKIKPIQELIKFQKQVEALTSKREQKSNKKKQKRIVKREKEKHILQEGVQLHSNLYWVKWEQI